MQVSVFCRDAHMGAALVSQFTAAGHHAVMLDCGDQDDSECIEGLLRSRRPDFVVSGIEPYITDVEGSVFVIEPRPPANITAVLARATASIGTPFIQLSTAEVFSGSKGSLYFESDKPDPVGAYGRALLECELNALRFNKRAFVLRTGHVFSPQDCGFLQSMLWFIKEKRPEITVVDGWQSPTGADDLAAAVVGVAERLASRFGDDAPHRVFHLASSPPASWVEFAIKIFQGARQRGCEVPNVRSIARRPNGMHAGLDRRLDSNLVARVHGVTVNGWHRSLERCLDQLLGTRADSSQVNS